jgi:dihydroorotase
MEVETKECEFTFASFGSIGLETAFAAANTALREQVEIGDIVRTLYEGPRNILGVPIPSITKNAKAEITLFDPTRKWTYTGSRHSLSANDALKGASLTGTVIGIFSKGQLMIN